MVKKNQIKEVLKENDIDELDKFNKNSMEILFLNILEDEMNNFNYENDIEYLDNLIKLLPKYINNKKVVHDRLENIHQLIKTYLVQKPGYIEKTNHNYKILKNIINNIEIIQMSILYDYNLEYEESKYKLIDYIVFEMKNPGIFKDALKKFPYLVNYFDENDKKIIVNVIEKYIEEVINYNKENGIDNILYYDEIIDSIINSPKFIFDIIDKQTILKNIKQEIKNVKKEKNRKVFYLNSLIEKIIGNEDKNTYDFLEYKYNIPTTFNIAIKSEVKSIINNYTMAKDRKVIDDYILTFDGEGAEEIDDALSIKILDNDNILLGVHIACPTALIDKDSIIFDEAAKRTTSIYLSDKTYSMFPEELSCDLISLKQGNYRNAISYYFELDKNGNVVNNEFIKSIIKVNRNMSYNEFNKILTMNGNNKLKETITNLSNISPILKKYYHEDPLYVEINRKNSNVTNTNIIGATNGEKVIESVMIFTNYMVAKYFNDNNLPFVYRNHNIDYEMMNKLDEFKYNINEGDYYKYIDMIKSIYPKAVYEIECKGHFGLGLDYYSHITSPLRRFADMLNLICLDRFYFNEYNEDTINKTKTFLLKHSERINAKRNGIEKFSINYENLTR